MLHKTSICSSKNWEGVEDWKMESGLPLAYRRNLLISPVRNSAGMSTQALEQGSLGDKAISNWPLIAISINKGLERGIYKNHASESLSLNACIGKRKWQGKRWKGWSDACNRDSFSNNSNISYTVNTSKKKNYLTRQKVKRVNCCLYKGFFQ